MSAGKLSALIGVGLVVGLIVGVLAELYTDLPPVIPAAIAGRHRRLRGQVPAIEAVARLVSL